MSTLTELRSELLKLQTDESAYVLDRDNTINSLNSMCFNKPIPFIGSQSNWMDALRWSPANPFDPSTNSTIEDVTFVERRKDDAGAPLNFLQACGGTKGSRFYEALMLAHSKLPAQFYFTFEGTDFPTQETFTTALQWNDKWVKLVKSLTEVVEKLRTVRGNIARVQKAISDVTTDTVIGNVANQVQGQVVQNAIDAVTTSFNKNKQVYTLLAVLIVGLLVFNLIRKRKSKTA